MKERPILFSAPMVRAILDGKKTQTRRVAKVASLKFMSDGDKTSWCIRFSSVHKGAMANYGGGKLTEDQARRIIASQYCPYGKIGDRLWVRETWARDSEDGALFYRADVGSGNEADDWQRNIDDGANGYRWRPSIHMPRDVSRITLEVTGVRVERLQDISEAGAMAEGSQWSACGAPQDGSYKAGYAQLWESINGAGSWPANPWVWVIEFKVME